MPYSAAQLTTFYTNENLGIQPSAAEALLLQAYATQNASGALSDAATIANVLVFAQDKTDVALATYQFFTGASPTLAGLAYLVHGGGNANDLSSAYYAGFNKENRYYNFAINLATASASAAGFAASYGPLTFAQAVVAAYEQIVGSGVVGATQAAAAEASIISSQSFFAAVAAQRAVGANQDIATKAIMIGYILEEAQKADIGIYAKAIDQFVTTLGNTGTATTGNLLTLYPPANQPGVTFTLTAGIDNFAGSNGNDTVNGVQSGLTPLDNINGGGGNNVFNLIDNLAISGVPASAILTNFQTINLESAVSVTFSSAADAGALALNSISGGAATLTAATSTNVSSTSTGGASVTGGANVSVADTGGVDVVTGAVGAIAVADAAQAANNVTVSGGTSVSVSVTGSTGGAIAIGGTTAPTGSVTVSEAVSTAAATGATIAVTGGTTVGVTETSANAKNTTVTFGAVTVTGTANTTAVSVTESAAATASATVAGVVDSAVAITDLNGASATLAGTIATVSLTNVASATITDGALSTLSFAGTDGAVTITDNLTKATATTLALNLTSAKSGGIVDANNEISTVNITESGNSTLTGITDTGLKTVTVAGTGGLTIDAFNAAVTSLTISGAAGLTGTAGAPLNVSGGAATLTITDSSSAAVNVKIAGSQTFAGATSSGTDTVTISADANKAIAAGTAINNEIILSGVGTAFLDVATKTQGNISGFTVLGTDAGSSGVFDLKYLPTITSIDVTRAGFGGVQFINVVNGTALSIDAAIVGGVTYQLADATGATDSATVTIGTATTSGITTTGQLTLQDSTLVGLGNVTINSTSAPVVSPALPVTNVVSVLNDTGLTSLTLTGIANTTISSLIDNGSSLTVTNAGTGVLDKISLLNAANDPNLKTLNLNGNVELTSATLQSTAGVTISGATDNAAVTLTLTGAATGKTDVVTLGNGAVTVTDTGAGTVNITAGTGADSITTSGAGSVSITLGGATVGTDTVSVTNATSATIVIAAGANNVSATGAGVNSVTIGASGASAENVTFGTGTNTAVLGAHTGADNISVAAKLGISAIITGLNGTATSADKITFLGDGLAAGPVVVFSTTAINAYANGHALDSTQLSTALAAMFDTVGNLGAGLAQHTIGEFNFQGNTYIVEQANALGTPVGAADTVVELIGTVPVTALSIGALGVLALHG